MTFLKSDFWKLFLSIINETKYTFQFFYYILKLKVKKKYSI